MDTTSTSKVRLAGAWSGVLDVPLDQWTVSMLRAEISRRSGGDRPPESIKLISGGKVLLDRDEEGRDLTLSQVGLRNNSKILASSVEPASPQFAAEDMRCADVALLEAERSQRLSRIRSAAERMTARHTDGSLPFENYNIELEDQNGNKVNVGSEADKRGLMMGLMLHASAKKLIRNKQYKDALETLVMAEEAFSLCDHKLTKMIDNVPILQIDMVWCYFLLQDISLLSMAGIRLANARKGLEVSHGKDSSRVRILQKGRHVELAVYLRLELLEGIVSYHSGQFQESKKLLSSAHAKYLQLQVQDETLALLMSMGYKERSAKRALRMNNQDIASAVDFLVEEKAKRARKHEDDVQQRAKIAELKSFGTTPMKKAVDIVKLDQLENMGFTRVLGAEALRVNENDIERALMDLTKPESFTNLLLQVEKQKQKQRELETDIEMLVSMGYDRPAVVSALRNSETRDEALKMLAATGPTSDNRSDSATSSSSNNRGDSTAHDNGPALAGALSSNDEILETRDVEMEDEIARELTGDPLSDYDIEVSLEGEAISQYLAMLEAAES